MHLELKEEQANCRQERLAVHCLGLGRQCILNQALQGSELLPVEQA